MKLNLIQPQEVEVFYILPAIRSRMASVLKAQGKSQKEIAALLYVQESTISQYLNSKRAAGFKFNAAIDREIGFSVARIAEKEDLIRETQKVLGLVRRERDLLCGLHKAVADVPKGCDVCYCK